MQKANNVKLDKVDKATTLLEAVDSLLYDMKIWQEDKKPQVKIGGQAGEFLLLKVKSLIEKGLPARSDEKASNKSNKDKTVQELVAEYKAIDRNQLLNNTIRAHLKQVESCVMDAAHQGGAESGLHAVSKLQEWLDEFAKEAKPHFFGDCVKAASTGKPK